MDSHKSGEGKLCTPDEGVEGMQLIAVAANGEIQVASLALGKLIKSSLDTTLAKLQNHSTFKFCYCCWLSLFAVWKW